MMKLQPSKIHFSQELLFHYSAEVSINNLCPIKKTKQCNSSCCQMKNNLPKLQAFKKGDCYFALDNNCLTFYRRLELTGHLGDQRTVDVDVVPTRKIPKNVLDTSECSSVEDSSSSESDYSDDDSDSVYDFQESSNNKIPPSSSFSQKLKKFQQVLSDKLL